VPENVASPQSAAADAAVQELLGQLLERRFVLTDRAGSVTRWSRSAEVLFGRPTKDALGKPLLTLIGCRIDAPVQGGAVEAMARRTDGAELRLELTFVPVPMSQSLEFTGLLEALEAGVTIERLQQRHRAVCAWIAACLVGRAELADEELSAGTIIAFRPLDDALLRELERADGAPGASEPIPSGGTAVDVAPELSARVDDALRRATELEEAFDDAAAALEEARSGSDEARGDAQAARREAAEAAARLELIEKRNSALRQQLDETRR
jgi:hypothetical protein